MGELIQRLSQRCPDCAQSILARRIEGRYINERGTRILIWECPECGALWQKPRRGDDGKEKEER